MERQQIWKDFKINKSQIAAYFVLLAVVIIVIFRIGMVLIKIFYRFLSDYFHLDCCNDTDPDDEDFELPVTNSVILKINRRKEKRKHKTEGSSGNPYAIIYGVQDEEDADDELVSVRDIFKPLIGNLILAAVTILKD
ncbi:hypothetical protein JTE90_013460 [Oedothorax gibbosus]|uniref:Uncharacterized protein n=1 Tax=Oedothorax gibbosus TaxID=931172 RepID=A0AAV6VMQ6_9ARAC|nr:hypothetical protein JTE90_013460 [Oedothorax gibbosus]